MLTKEDARKAGHCETCAAFLPEGRVKCGTFPLNGEFCPRATLGKVGKKYQIRGPSGARSPRSGTVKHPKVEEGQCEMF